MTANDSAIRSAKFKQTESKNKLNFNKKQGGAYPNINNNEYN